MHVIPFGNSLGMVMKNINLLIAFDALIKDRQVTIAAKRLHISQSAMSKKLEQLRILFDDPLFIQTRSGMQPTSFAVEVYPKIKSLIILAEDIFQGSEIFTSKNISRDIYIGMPGAICDFFLTALSDTIIQKAPNAKLHIRNINAQNIEENLQKNEIDIAITYGLNLPESLKSTLILTDDIVCMGRKTHPIFEYNQIPVKEYLRYEHIVLVYDELSKLSGDELLKTKGYPPRNIAMTVSSVLGILPMLERSDRLFSINKVFAESYAKNFNLDYRPLPAFVPSIKFYMLWSPMMDNAEWHRWLREKIKGCF